MLHPGHFSLARKTGHAKVCGWKRIMNDTTINTGAGMFKLQKNCTPEQILATGGATPFGNKSDRKMDD